MKRAVLLTLCLALLVEVCAKGGRGGGRISSPKTSSKSSSSSSSSSKGTSSSTGGKTGSRPKSTDSTSNKPVKDVSGRGWGRQYPTKNNEPGGAKRQGNTYPYWNPNNKIMSPRYGGNYAYGAYGQGYGQGGSPFAHSVESMGYRPSIQSKGFGKQAVVAAGAGAVGGMALGYGLGSFPRPHFNFHSPQEEYHYNHYMYQHYGSQESRNTNKRTQTHGKSSSDSGSHQGVSNSSYGDDGNHPPVLLKPPPQSYDKFMDTCMKRSDLLQSERTNNQTQPPKTTTVQTPLTTPVPKDFASPSPQGKKRVGQENETEQKGAEKEQDHDEVVSILEIGYPALIEQLKARECMKTYMFYTHSIAEKQWKDAYGHGAKPVGIDFISISLLYLIGSLLFY
ncbi:uncharacterized protein LOC105906877 [Clupea harengus]|uniref:Uncharacterized protein LOC105906877 n=1 Tax=Clupea harengus TaxID=7950 RepID=A0A6P8FTY0_CLUHA|nr:uncharacterized protein LOC105906877 [Clupea harengus]